MNLEEATELMNSIDEAYTLLSEAIRNLCVETEARVSGMLEAHGLDNDQILDVWSDSCMEPVSVDGLKVIDLKPAYNVATGPKYILGRYARLQELKRRADQIQSEINEEETRLKS